MAGPVVTLFESYGAGAELVGPELARRLGVPYIGQRYSSVELEEQEAREKPGFFDRLRGGLGSLGVDATLGGVDQFGDSEALRENVRFVLEAVENGAVILGRNSTVILGDDPRAMHVKLDGILADRLARAMAYAGIDHAEASRRQVREDRMRAELSLRSHNWDPRHNDRFDLVVNTSQVSDDQVVELLIAAYPVICGGDRP